MINSISNNSWPGHKISELCQALLDLGESADETLCTVVKVSAVIEQLLLGVATRPSEGRSRELIIDTVAVPAQSQPGHLGWLR